MRSVETTGKTVDEAIRKALDELKLDATRVKVKILDEGKRGVFGLGAKEAVVLVTEKEVIGEVATPAVEVKETKKVVKENKPKAEKEAPVKAEVVEEAKEVKVEENLEPVDAPEAKEFLTEIFKGLGVDVNIDTKGNDDKVVIDLSGPDMGIVIGKRGETLDAIQYLTSLVVNKKHDGYTKVVIDTENYRAKREETLRKLAVRLAKKVDSTHRKVTLEPMNAAERRIIHSELQNFKGITTFSIGNEPARKVVIAPERN